MIKQIRFYDKENDTVQGGILLDNGDIICGCCGGLFPKDDESSKNIVITDIYHFWVNISDAIMD